MRFQATVVASALLSLSLATVISSDLPGENCTLNSDDLQGHDCLSHGTLNFEDIFRVIPNSNFPECNKECERAPQCQSTKTSSDGNGGVICTLYNEALFQMGFVKKASGADFYAEKGCLSGLVGRCDLHNGGFESDVFSSSIYPWKSTLAESPKKSSVSVGRNNDGSGYARAPEGTQFFKMHKVGSGEIWLEQSMKDDFPLNNKPFTLEYYYNFKSFTPDPTKENPTQGSIYVVHCGHTIDTVKINLAGKITTPKNRWFKRSVTVNNQFCQPGASVDDFALRYYSGFNSGDFNFSADIGVDGIKFVPV